MPQPVLTASDMLAWLEKTSQGWRALIQTHPEVLAMPCTVVGVSTAAGLLQHIVAVELRYAERLAGMPPSDYPAVSCHSTEAIYVTHERAAQLLRQQIERDDVDWDERIEFITRSFGPARSTRKTILFHAMLHSIRHYAQLATLVRENGITPTWPMDYLPMNMELVNS